MTHPGEPLARTYSAKLATGTTNRTGWLPKRWSRRAKFEHDADVLWSIAGALRHAADPVSVPLLVSLAAYPDADVRYQAAVALPAAMTTR